MLSNLSILSKINISLIAPKLNCFLQTFNSIQDQPAHVPLGGMTRASAFNSIQDQRIVLVFLLMTGMMSFNSIQDQRGNKESEEDVIVLGFQFYPRSTLQLFPTWPQRPELSILSKINPGR